MIPVYILGILLRYGPQHGYNIKKIVSEQLADFSKIKLPTIYYHLENMQKKGLLRAEKEKSTSRPEKTVYSITELGISEFNNKLRKTLDFDYCPKFDSDSSFFFSDYLDKSEIKKSLIAYNSKLDSIIKHIENHREDVINYVPKNFQIETNIIFNHHIVHFKAEKQWVIDTIKLLTEGEVK
jgi:DNA-binding PadR family transcriptional regulator